MNVDQLLRTFTKSKAEEALFHMVPLKYPGPDGLGAIFFQTYLNLLRDNVCAAVLNFLNRGTFLPSINHIFIALISKFFVPTSVNEFQPISLCNILYKLIDKILANKLKKILPLIRSSNQSVFIDLLLIISWFFMRLYIR